MVSSIEENDRMKVLLVDDEESLLEQAKLFLKKEDKSIQVEISSSPEKALKLLNNSEYDAIISDYQMPEIDGLKLLKTIKKERNKDIPFIMFTGKGREEVAIEALNLGADRYLQKGGSPKSQYSVLAQAIRQEVENWRREKELKSINWLLNKSLEEETYTPPYGDLTELNTEREILDTVGKDTLREIADNFMSLLDTSCAVYEKNGDYALGIFASNWCKFLDKKSHELCNTDDKKEAVESGDWICHESCWNASKASIEKGGPVDFNCSGGIHLYAVPIRAGGEIIGSINFGYGDPPKNPDKLEKISKKYDISIDQLRKNADSYESRPQFIIEIAKNRLRTSARLIGEIVERKRSEDKLKKAEREKSLILNSTNDIISYHDTNHNLIWANRAYSEATGETVEEMKGRKCYEIWLGRDKTCEECPVDKALESGESVMREVSFPEEEKYWLMQGNPVRDEEGKIIGVIETASDITERKKAEKAVQERE